MLADPPSCGGAPLAPTATLRGVDAGVGVELAAAGAAAIAGRGARGAGERKMGGAPHDVCSDGIAFCVPQWNEDAARWAGGSAAADRSACCRHFVLPEFDSQGRRVTARTRPFFAPRKTVSLMGRCRGAPTPAVTGDDRGVALFCRVRCGCSDQPGVTDQSKGAQEREGRLMKIRRPARARAGSPVKLQPREQAGDAVRARPAAQCARECMTSGENPGRCPI